MQKISNNTFFLFDAYKFPHVYKNICLNLFSLFYLGVEMGLSARWLNKFVTKSLYIPSSLEFNAFHVRIKFSIFAPRELMTLCCSSR